MSKESKVTYKMVKKAADDLIAEGIYPANDRVRATTGGASNIIGAFLRQWRDDREAARLLKSTPLDDGIKVTIQYEIDRHVELNTESLQNRFDQQKDSCEAVQNELADSQHEIESLSRGISNLKDSHSKESITFEKKISKVETLVETQKTQLDLSTAELVAANQRIELANGEISNLNQQLGKATGDIENKAEKIDDLRNQLSNTSADLKVSNQKISDLEKQLSKTTGELENETKKTEELRAQNDETSKGLLVASQKNTELEKEAGKKEEALSQLSAQVNKFQKDTEQLQKGLREAEKAASAAQGKLDQIEAQEKK